MARLVMQPSEKGKTPSFDQPFCLRFGKDTLGYTMCHMQLS